MALKKHFTPRDINQLIPKLEQIFEHIEACRARAQALAASNTPAAKPATAEAIARNQLIRSQVQFLTEAVQDDVNHILRLGGVTKDLEAGLVDFPGRVHGEEVWLCWKRGESAVRYWHALNEGFSSRQILPRLEPPTRLH